MFTGYRPWLDGIRTIAVGLVAVDHAFYGPRSIIGGFGVALFFTLSGYLITGMLLDERARAGRIDLRAFYLRRAARLFPALGVMVVVILAVHAVTGRPLPVEQAFVALSYLGNYALVETWNDSPLIVHTWSLAVEEHFYLVWPLALIAVLRKRDLGVLLRTTLLVSVAAVAWRKLLLDGSLFDLPPRLAYVGSFERADSLLLGCAAAIGVRMGWRPPRGSAAVGAVAVVWLTANHLAGDRQSIYGWALLAVAAAVLFVGLDARNSILRRALSLRPLVWAGTLSYGFYLWHIPTLRVAQAWGLPGWAGVAFGAVPTVLSFYLIERPIRDRVRAATTPRTAEPVRAEAAVAA